MPVLLDCGIRIEDVYSYSLAEMNYIIESRQRTLKEKTLMNYELAKMVAMFVGCSLNGGAIPLLEEIYPAFAEDKEEKETHKEQENGMGLYKELFLDFANNHNKKLRSEK